MTAQSEPRDATVARLLALLDELPPELAERAFAHVSWTAKRADSYERLAFLGDSVLALAVTSHIYPSLEADRYGAGQLTPDSVLTGTFALDEAAADVDGVLAHIEDERREAEERLRRLTDAA